MEVCYALPYELKKGSIRCMDALADHCSIFVALHHLRVLVHGSLIPADPAAWRELGILYFGSRG
jgi:hypothetical protein